MSQQRARLELRANFYSQRVVTAWNGLEPELRNARTVECFKHQVKKKSSLTAGLPS